MKHLNLDHNVAPGQEMACLLALLWPPKALADLRRTASGNRTLDPAAAFAKAIEAHEQPLLHFDSGNYVTCCAGSLSIANKYINLLIYDRAEETIWEIDHIYSTTRPEVANLSRFSVRDGLLQQRRGPSAVFAAGIWVREIEARA